MTTSLWDAIDWYNKCPASWKKRAYQGLLDQLNRKWAPTKAIERGIAFEDKICNGKNPIEEIVPDLKEKFTTAYNLIHGEGHNFQAKAKKFVESDEKEFIIYGKLDVFFEKHADYPDGLIIDIKTTGNYRGKASYLSKWQHRVYTWLKRIKDFKYVVFEFNEAGLLCDVHTIDYHVDDFDKIGKEIMDNLKKVRGLLKSDKDLSKAYLKKFNLYN